MGKLSESFLATSLKTVCVVVLFCGVATAADPPAVESEHGMVVAAEEHAARAGLEMLELGGNAIDAAVAVSFALAVTLPEAGNIGGGGFMIASMATAEGRQEFALDFREVAPQAAYEALYVDARARGVENPSTLGALAAGVPGSVAGMLEALERSGTLSREQVLAPAIRLAEDGYAVAKPTARHFKNSADAMRRFGSTAKAFYASGRPLRAGEILKQPDLARTLRRISENGRSGFYEGPVAEAIVATMKAHGGIMTVQDLANYEVRVRKPVRFRYRDRTIVTMPPPSSGGVCLKQILGMLEPHNVGSWGHNSSRTLHFLAESMRRSFADRNRFLGDPDHHELPLDRLLSRDHIAAQGKSIQLQKVTPSSTILGDGPASQEKEETTHYSIVDKHRNAVAVTTTLNGAFGSKLVVAEAGFLLNNEMDDFTAEPGKPNLYGLVQGRTNAVLPGARPLSSMTPTVVLNDKGQPQYVLGSPGGPTIITNVLQTLVNLIDFGLAPQAAVNAAKIHHQCLPDRIFHEREFAEDVLDALRGRGHRLKERRWIGDLQLIEVKGATLHGAADPRGAGVALGY